jgi:catechol 2,3-dioxygenase-like lactoylglutathione lyase family enzyme
MVVLMATSVVVGRSDDLRSSRGLHRGYPCRVRLCHQTNLELVDVETFRSHSCKLRFAAQVVTREYRAIFAIRKNGRVALQRMDNVGIVVESLDAAISFFAELGLELEGRAMIEGDWSGRVTGLRDQRVEIAMMRTPDGHSRIELSRFLTPPAIADHRNAPVNALGYLRVMFAVDDLDDTLTRLREHGAQLVDEVVQYEDVYRLCYIRGPEGILIGLAEQIG